MRRSHSGIEVVVGGGAVVGGGGVIGAAVVGGGGGAGWADAVGGGDVGGAVVGGGAAVMVGLGSTDGSGLGAGLTSEGWELGTKPVSSDRGTCVVAISSATEIASPESPLPPQAVAKTARAAKTLDR